MTTEAMNTTELSLLRERLADLEQEVGRLKDESDIRKVQYSYGYFIDKSQYNECVDLFAEDGEVWFLGGIYKGKAGVRRLYIERFQTNFTDGHNGPRYGWLLDHPQLQMVIDVAPDRKTAKVRGRSTMQAGLHETATGQQRAWWEGGIYENEYVREDGVWKIKALRYYPFWHGTLDALRNCLTNAVLRYGKPVVVVETAFPWTNSAPVLGIPATPAALALPSCPPPG